MGGYCDSYGGAAQLDQKKSPKTLQRLTFVLGGAASGKSYFAEQLVIATEKPKIYIATAQAFDQEMQKKIAQHQVQRGPNWVTHEAPIDLASTVLGCDADTIVLIDCLTLWLTNVLLAERDVDADIDQLLNSLASALCPIVVVSNEVGQGIVPDNALSRRFRALQGRLNQRVATQADTVVGVMAGLPFVLKGELPT